MRSINSSVRSKKVVLAITMLIVLFLSVFTYPKITRASSLTLNQINAIVTLLQSFGADQTVINKVKTLLTGQTTHDTSLNTSYSIYNNSSYTRNTSKFCPNLYRNLYLGAKGPDVRDLQLYLKQEGFFNYPEITGYFGPVTMSAVQRFQKTMNIVSYGSPKSTGFGVVGPRTRSVIAQKCNENIVNVYTRNNEMETACISGGIKYQEGAELSCVVNGNSQQCIADAQFVCKNGNWVVKGGLPLPKPKPQPRPNQCVDGSKTYREGTRLSCLTGKGCIADAKFVCENGRWVKKGDLPLPKPQPRPPVKKSNPNQCIDDGEVYEEGAKLDCIIDDGARVCIADAKFVCTNGTWVKQGDDFGPKPQKRPDVIVSINEVSTDNKYIQKEIFGLNSIFGYEKDSYWDSKKDIYSKIFYIANGGVLRYPGGAVTDFYHWNKVTKPFTDLWDPEQNAPVLQDAEYMSLDEYLKHTQNLKTTPLVGINMLSGWLFSRESEALKEARELVKKVDQYFPNKRKLYYLGNENYANHKRHLSESEYADLFNKYTKEILSTGTKYTKFILNWNNKYWDGNQHEAELSYSWKKLLNKVKSNVDIIDVHTYWGYKVLGETADEKWQSYLNSSEVTGPENIPYTSYLKGLRVALDKAGFSDKKLAVLEWGVLPIRKNGIQDDMTAAQIAIIDADMFISLLKSDVVDMAAFWPLRWDGPWKLDNFAFLNLKNKITIVNRFLSHFAPLKNGYKVLPNVSSRSTDVKVLAAIHGSGTKMQIYVLNRSNQTKAIRIYLKEKFKNVLVRKVSGYKIIGDIKEHTSKAQWFNDENQFSVQYGEISGSLQPWSLIRVELDLKK